MGYIGKTFNIECAKGGLTGNDNIDMIEPQSMLSPSRNLNLNRNGRERRGGTAHVNAAAFTDTPQVMGVYDFTLIDSTQFIISALKDGKVYKDDTNTIKTGMSTTTFYSFETFEDELFICDGKTKPQTWNGVAGATSDITSVPTDWTGTNYPQQLIKHGRGVSERLWGVGLPSNPNIVYASANGDGNDFSDTNVVTINIETGDGFGVIGGIEFGDRLLCFGKNKTYVVDDSDTDSSLWGYDAAQWEGGAANFRLIIKTPTDLVCMQEDGEIYSVTAAQKYGDYKAASLTRASFMHEWIKSNIRLGYANLFHGVYDKTLRAIKIFCVRNGQTEVNTALTYFIDRPPQEAWMIHDNQDNASGYDASVAAEIRVGTGSYKIYTGDYSGEIWKLEEENVNDNDKAYYSGFKTPNMHMDDTRGDKNLKRGWILTKPEGDHSVYINWWVDGVAQTQKSVSLDGAGGLLDSFILGEDASEDVLGGNGIIENSFDLNVNGKRIQLEVYNSSTDEDFFISQLAIDYKPLGKQPED